MKSPLRKGETLLLISTPLCFRSLTLLIGLFCWGETSCPDQTDSDTYAISLWCKRTDLSNIFSTVPCNMVSKQDVIASLSKIKVGRGSGGKDVISRTEWWALTPVGEWVQMYVPWFFSLKGSFKGWLTHSLNADRISTHALANTSGLLHKSQRRLD